MRVNRVFVDAPLQVGTQVRLPEPAVAHLVRVLRSGVGDACVLFNGDGCDYPARIAARVASASNSNWADETQ